MWDTGPPDFTLRDPEGKAVHPRERAVFLNFWATWCPPCREEMPTMERAYRDYKSRGLEILAVSLDAGGAAAVAARVKAFMSELTLSWTLKATWSGPTGFEDSR